VAIAAVLSGAAALIAVHLLLRDTYWDYSEGVYALTAQMLLHGGDLYGRIVGAQPPGVFLAGAALLAIHDSLEWLRFGVGCLQLGAGLIAARIVYRVTANPVATALTPALMLLTPWAVHEHGALTPELVALPVIMGATLLSIDGRRGAVTGVLCALIVLIKLPLAIPAVVIVAVAADRRRAAAWGAGALAAGLLAATLAGGGNFWRDIVIAQLHTGSQSVGLLKGFWAQAGWNVLGLLVCALVAIRLRAQALQPRLLWTMTAVAVANLVTFLSNFKVGTGLNITVPVESSLVPLAVCGAVFAVRGAGAQRTSWSAPRAALHTVASHRRRWLAALCTLALVFTVAQSVSLIAAPHNPIPFLRAFSAPAWEILLTGPQLRQAVAAARACPPGEAYGGSPLVAFMAGRRLPADQPDQFLPSHSSTLAAVQAQIAAVRPLCPGQ
jgi:hypothetical protein